MAKTPQDGRPGDSRGPELGERRSTGPGEKRATADSCPNCGRNTVTEAGSAAGGWWFVCDQCDHLWDERARRAEKP